MQHREEHRALDGEVEPAASEFVLDDSRDAEIAPEALCRRGRSDLEDAAGAEAAGLPAFDQADLEREPRETPDESFRLDRARGTSRSRFTDAGRLPTCGSKSSVSVRRVSDPNRPPRPEGERTERIVPA